MKDPNQCNRCFAGVMRVVRSRRVGDVQKQQLKCTNPNCDHSFIRDKPREDKLDDDGSSGDE